MKKLFPNSNPREWTLFLDRDEVVNACPMGDYVKKLEDFVFIENVPKAIRLLEKCFHRIVMVTNQQGIGKKLMTDNDLLEIHKYMMGEIEKEGGRIDKIYFAPNLASENSDMRKPGKGMAVHAQKDFPEINFQKSLMIGDTESDMLFAKNLNMKAISVGETKIESDAHFDDLYIFAKYFNEFCRSNNLIK